MWTIILNWNQETSRFMTKDQALEVDFRIVISSEGKSSVAHQRGDYHPILRWYDCNMVETFTL